MDKKDMQKIFGVEDYIKNGKSNITVEKFLEFLKFKDCEPTKESMLVQNGKGNKEKDIMGFENFIKSGNFNNK